MGNLLLLPRTTRVKAKEAFTIVTAIATILALSGFLYVLPNHAFGAAPGDFGLTEGDVVSATGSDDPDVYIVNEQGYKRLFLNPVIFGFYGHLGGFAAVKTVSASTRDAFPTSGLFRLDGDEKVYGVETTGEDTGMLHWVNTTGAQAVADDPDFFKKVFVINQNEFDWYSKGSDYTSVNDVPDYVRDQGTTPSGPVSVSVSPNTPAARVVTRNAEAVELFTMRFSGTTTINSLTFKRQGAGATGDFTNVYIYDGATRLTSGKSLSSSTGQVTFISLGVAVSGTKDLTLVGDLAGTNGNVNWFSLTSISANDTVSGLPISGNAVTFSGADSGTYDVAKTGSLSNPRVGQQGAQFSEFKITVNTEAASIKRMTLIQGGTVNAVDITNLKLKTGLNEWSGSMTTDGFAVFDLDDGFFIKKGGNAIFKMYGDINGAKKGETLDFYFEENADLWAIGDQYGYTMAEGTNGLDTATEATTLELQGGTLTIAFNGPATANIGTDTDDTVLMRYAMTAQANIEVRKTEFNLCKDDLGTGTYDDAYAATGWSDLDDFKVTDEDSGEVVMGPQDGSAFTDDDGTACDGDVGGSQNSFSDTYDLFAGVTRNFAVSADIKIANADGSGIAIVATDKIKVELDDWSEDTEDLTVMKYTGTNTAVADADIVPNADISSNEFTINAASLTLGLAATPASDTFIKGATDVDFVGNHLLLF